jgi:CRISP-associated protein Cas1
MDVKKKTRLFIQIKKDTLPQVKDKYPFIYLERGRLEIDDSSVKWIDSECNLVRIPTAMIHTILLGPGTSITHEAIKVIAAANCTLCWVGEDSLLFYAVGHTPTANTRNIRKQMELASNPKKSVEVARRMFSFRFPNNEVSNKTLQELKGMEGLRVKNLYQQKAEEYQVGWKGRSYVPGKFEMGDMTNQVLTSANAALYGLVTSAIFSIGFSPHVGFIHSGSPLPFVYDIADLYKDYLTIDLAFKLTLQMAGEYNKYAVAEEFRVRVTEMGLLENIGKNIKYVLGMS